jgi:DNA-binding transcriptional ArsR family regulator
MAADTLTRVFSALADPTRRDIVARLAEGDATVGQLAEPYQMTLQAVYKHLRVLEDAGLVSRPPRPVRLETEVLTQMEIWIERYRQRAEQRYRRLDALLATMSPSDDKDGADDVNDPRDDHRG